MPTYADLGRLLKQKHPVYQAHDEETLGQRYAELHPEVAQQYQPTPKQGFISRAVSAVVDPAKRYGQLVGEAGAQFWANADNAGDAAFLKRTSQAPRNLPKGVTMPAGEMAGVEQAAKRMEARFAPKVMDQKSLDKFSTVKGAALEGAKRTAGGASYFIPGGKAVGLAGIGQRALQGAVSSGLAEFSDENSTAESVVKRTALGGLFGGGIEAGGQLAGKALKGAVKPLNKMADVVEEKSIVKAIGRAPNAGEGGQKTLTKVARAGLDTSNAETLASSADEAIASKGQQLLDELQQARAKGVKVDFKKVISGLKAAQGGAQSQQKKAMYQSVIEALEGDSKTIADDIVRFAKLKTEYGPNGRWSSLQPEIDKMQAGIWRDAYMDMNAVLDDALKGAGFENLRELNDAIHTAELASKWAHRVGNLTPSKNSFGLTDMISAGVGASAAGIPGAVGSVVARRVMESPQAAKAGVGFIRGMGNVAGKLGAAGIPNNGITNVLRNTSGVGVSGSALSAAKEPASDTYTGANQYSNNESTHSASIDPLAGNSQIPQDPSGQFEINPSTNQWQPVQQQSGPKYTLEKVEEALIQATLDGNSKAVQQLRMIYDLVLAREERLAKAGKSNVGKASAKDVYTAQSGLESLGKLGELSQDSGKLLKSTLPLALGARDLKAVQDNVKDALLRLRSGAAITDAELEFYSQQIPTVLDPPEVRDQKLQTLFNFFNSFAQSEATVGNESQGL